jgi:hypothetical protein
MGSPPSPDDAAHGTPASREAPETGGEEPNRPLTIDDVPRLGSGAGIAVGCGVLVLVAIVLFWVLRGWLLRGP